jgi:hypothetical protein
LAKRTCSASANVVDHWAKVLIALFSPFYSRGNAGAVSFDRNSLHALRISAQPTKSYPARFGGLQGGFGAGTKTL